MPVQWNDPMATEALRVTTWKARSRQYRHRSDRNDQIVVAKCSQRSTQYTLQLHSSWRLYWLDLYTRQHRLELGSRLVPRAGTSRANSAWSAECCCASACTRAYKKRRGVQGLQGGWLAGEWARRDSISSAECIDRGMGVAKGSQIENETEYQIFILRM